MPVYAETDLHVPALRPILGALRNASLQVQVGWQLSGCTMHRYLDMVGIPFPQNPLPLSFDRGPSTWGLVGGPQLCWACHVEVLHHMFMLIWDQAYHWWHTVPLGQKGGMALVGVVILLASGVGIRNEKGR